MDYEYEISTKPPIYGVGKFGKTDGRQFNFYGVPTILADLLKKKHPEKVLDRVYNMYREAKNVEAIPFLETIAAALSKNKEFTKILNRNIDLSAPLGLTPIVLGKVKKKYVIMKPYSGKVVVLHLSELKAPEGTLPPESYEASLNYHRDLLTSALRQTNLNAKKVGLSKICSAILETVNSMKTADKMDKVFFGRLLLKHPLINDNHRRNILLKVPTKRLYEFLKDEVYGGNVDLMKTHFIMNELAKNKRQRIEIS